MALLTFPSSSETHKVQPTKHTTNIRKHHQHQQKPKPKPIPKPIPKSKPKSKSNPKQQIPPPPSSSSSSWDNFKNLLTCKQIDVVGSNKVNDPVKNNPNGYSKLSSCSSICSFRDVVHGNTRVVHRADNSPESSSVGLDSGLLNRKKHLNDGGSSSSSSKTLTGNSMRSNGHGSYTSCSRGMQFRKLSGCYECHAIVDPSR